MFYLNQFNLFPFLNLSKCALKIDIFAAVNFDFLGNFHLT